MKATKTRDRLGICHDIKVPSRACNVQRVRIVKHFPGHGVTLSFWGEGGKCLGWVTGPATLAAVADTLRDVLVPNRSGGVVITQKGT